MRDNLQRHPCVIRIATMSCIWKKMLSVRRMYSGLDKKTRDVVRRATFFMECVY